MRLLLPVVVLLLAVALRAPGLLAGMPHNPNPDEQAIVNRTAVLSTGDLNPHRFINPALYLYVSAAAFGVLFVADLARGAVSDLSGFGSQFLLDPTRFYLAARLVSLAAGLGTLLLIPPLARQMGAGRLGWLAALLVAVTPNHADHARRAMPDVPMLLLATLALLLAHRAALRGSRRLLFLAAVAAGLAAATKYNAWPLAGTALLAASLVIGRRFAPASWRASLLAALGLAIPASALAVAVFLALNPYLLLDSRQVLADLSVQAATMRNPEATWKVPLHLDVLIGAEFGPLLLPLALLGGYALWRRLPEAQIVPLAAVGVYAVAFGLSTIVNERWWLPALPVLAVYAAAGLEQAWSWLRRRGSRPTSANAAPRPAPLALAAFALVVALALLAPGSESVVRAVRASAPDTSTLATEWVQQHVPAGATLVYEDGIANPAPSIQTLRERLEALRWVRSPAAARVRLRLQALLELPAERPTYHLAYPIASLELNTFGMGTREADYDFSTLRARGVQYAVVSGSALDRAIQGQDRWPQRIAFYRWLLSEADLVATIPRGYWNDGPEVRVYRLR